MAHHLLVCAVICSNAIGNLDATTNIALNKPTYISSPSYPSSFTHRPGNVVDGNLNRNMPGGSCVETITSDPLPWWMVDLEQSYAIGNITIYNRGDWRQEWLHDFYIEVFHVNPLTWPDAQPTQCLFYNDILQTIETLTCDTPVVGRYVRIRKIPRGSQIRLFLCEVEITTIEGSNTLSDCGSYSTAIHQGKRIQSVNIQTVSSMRLTDCVVSCRFTNNCYDVSYNRNSQQCQLLTLRADSDDVIDDADWAVVSIY